MKRYLFLILCAFLILLPVGSEIHAEVDGVDLPEKTVTATPGCSTYDLQALLDENANGEYQLTVNIPAGDYTMTRPLFVYSNTTIKADENAKIMKRSSYGGMIETRLVNDDGGYDGNTNITIDGGVWDSMPVVESDGLGTETFRFLHCNNITIKNATLCNMPDQSHLIVFAGVQNATVSNCTFYGYTNWKDPEYEKEAVQLEMAHSDEIVPNQQTYVEWDDLPCDNITITGCEFYHWPRAIGSHTAVAGKFHSNIKITNNDFHDISGSAVRLYAFRDTVVSGNTFNNVGEGVIAYTYIDAGEKDIYFEPLNGIVDEIPKDFNITISDNEFKNISKYVGLWGNAIRVLGKADGADARPLAGVNIVDNKINTTYGYGVYAQDAPDLYISGNEFTNTSKDAIQLGRTCDDSIITNNTITKAKTAGIAVYRSSDVEVLSNTVSSAESAIYLLDAKNCYVGKDMQTGNTVTSSKDHGISVSAYENGTGSSSVKVIGNTVQSVAEHGINAYKSKNTTVEDNTIVSASGYGIFVNTNSTNSVIANNKIQSAGWHGISVTTNSNGVTILGNEILNYATKNEEGKLNGIFLYTSGGTSATKRSIISENTVVGNGTRTDKPGIKVNESNYVLISKNTIKNPAGPGIYLYKAKNCVVGGGSKDGNTITSPKERGIYLTTSCDSTKVQNNIITNAKKDGIGVYASKSVTISKNTITASADAIYVTTNCTLAKITDNIINSAGKSGIKVSTKCTRVTITGNKIKKYAVSSSAGCGIEMYQAGGTSADKRSTVSLNTIEASGTKTGRNGIKLSESPYVLISKNTITKPNGNGIYLYKSKGCVIGGGKKDGNKITSPTEKGIYLTTTCDGTKVLYNTVTTAKKEAIGAYASKGINISNNTVSSKADGIYITTKCNSAKIAGNTITSAGANAIKVSTKNTAITISNNIIKKYATSSKDAAAIYVYKSGGSSAKKLSKITGNIITGTGTSTKKFGIRVSESNYMLIESNTLTNIPGTAIYVVKSKNCTTNKNTIKTPKLMGIYYTTSCDGGKITSNTITKAADAAIKTYGAPSTTISSNKITVKSKKLRGIWVSNSKKTTVKSNTVSGTTKKNAIVITSSTGCKNTKNKIK